MKVGLMRTVDRFAGIPLCWLTGLRHRLLPASWHRLEHPDRPVLVIKMFGMGSVLLSVPLLDAVRSAYPASRIVYLTFATNAAVLGKIGHVDEILTIDTSSAWRFVSTAGRAVFAIRRLHPRSVFDLEFFSKFSTLISALSGAPIRIAFDLPARWRRWNITHPVALDHDSHVTQVFLRQISALGRTAAARPDLRLAADETGRAELDRLPGGMPADAEVIVVNINAGETSLDRRWPADRFMEVIRRTAVERPGARFFFTGLPAERAYVAEALSGQQAPGDRIVNCAGELSVSGLIALFERANLLLTNDSGPMHLAAAVGTPVVALFGPESPKLYGPAGRARVIYRALPCSPCLTMYNAKMFTCPYGRRCMQEISVEEVTAAMDGLLNSTQQAGGTSPALHDRS
jgi:ADP-heptose:LPS heptosyltransferase